MENLIIHELPDLHSPRMVLGFGGWMDGGRVSTGTIEHLVEVLGARRFAEIDSLEFYVLNFPVSTIPLTIVSDGERTVVRSISPMEQAALFRPHTEIRDGLVRQFAYQRNDFYYAAQANLILFVGEEPHIRWRSYADCLLHLCSHYAVREVYFVGSVAAPIPHTREPRLHSTFSDEQARARRYPQAALTEYEGPSSFITLFTRLAAQHGMQMQSLVVEIPHYPFLDMPTYPASILKVLAALSWSLKLEFDLGNLRRAETDLRRELDNLAAANEPFSELVSKLEEAYDLETSAADEELLRRLMDQVDLGGDGSPE